MSIVPKILIVDDMKTNIIIVEKLLLQHLDKEVIVLKANSADEALALSEKDEISLVISDVQMPGMDGYELATQLLSNKKTESVPIILMTAASKEELDRFKGYQSGAIDYLDKPINAEVLLTKVNILLSLYNARKELEKTIYVKDLFFKQLKGELKNDLAEINTATIQLLNNSQLSATQLIEVENIHQHNKSAQIILEEALKISELSPEEIHLDYYEEITL